MQKRKRRAAKWRKDQLKRAEEFIKKYPETMETRGGSLLPPTTQDYRKQLVFHAGGESIYGMFDQEPVGQGCYRTRPCPTYND